MGDPIAMVDGSIGICNLVDRPARRLVRSRVKDKTSPPPRPPPPRAAAVGPRSRLAAPLARRYGPSRDAEESPVRFRFVARQRCGAPARLSPRICMRTHGVHGTKT